MADKEKIEAISQERTRDAEQFAEIAYERHKVLRDQLERAERNHKARNNQEDALKEATELAKGRGSEKDLSSIISPAERRRGAPSKKQRAASLKSELKQIQDAMNGGDRMISKIIHNKSIENISDVAGSSIARPNALLSGSIAAFMGVTAAYFIAKYYGFQLSGFETIATFVFGWIIGILYDYFSVMIRGHRKNR